MEMSEVEKHIPAVTFLTEAANYFENRPKNGEDGAHWSNVYNSENCRAVARLVKQMLEALEAVHACGNGGAKLSRTASDKTRAAISKAKATKAQP